MKWCPSCGGVIGTDCFNPDECAWIAQQQEHNAQVQERIRQDAAEQRLAMLESAKIERLENLQHERDYWKLIHQCRTKPIIPQFIPAKIRTGDKVHGDGPFCHIRAEPGIHDVQCNAYGAMSVRATDGSMLGVKPEEVEEFIAWKINPHFKE